MSPHALWDPFQSRGVQWLVDHPTGFLWDDPGLGKTVQAVVAWARLTGLKRTLVLCSRQKIDDWAKEFLEWGQIQPTSLKAVGPQRREDLQSWDQGVLIVNREAVRLLPGLSERIWDLVILDESHHAKHRQSLFTQALWKLLAQRKWGLTATPIEGDVDVILQGHQTGAPRLQDLWSQLHWLDPVGWPSYWKFVNAFCVTQMTPWTQHEIVGPNFLMAPKLRQALGTLALRRRSEDVPGQLPEVTYEDWWLELSPEERRIYESMRRTMLVWIDSETALAAPTALAKLSRLIRLTLGPEGYGVSRKSSKSDVVTEFILDCPPQYKIVVASSYLQTLENLARRLDSSQVKVSSCKLSGQSKKPDQVLLKFNQPGGTQVLLMTSATGGEGLSFSQAQTLVVTDLPWSSTQYFQLTRRIVRGDSVHKHVRVVRVLAKGTVDELLVALHRSKRPLSPQEILVALRRHLKEKNESSCLYRAKELPTATF